MEKYPSFPKIARYNRDICITEKLDGANALVSIEQDDNGNLIVRAGSRNRWIPEGADHFGFQDWVRENDEALIATLGIGLHHGEWWGRKIARAYNQTDRTFSLFNTSRWSQQDTQGVSGLSVVPVLYEGPMSQNAINDAQHDLRLKGSIVAKGFMRPEGIVIYHTAANVMFKITLENDAVPKGKNA